MPARTVPLRHTTWLSRTTPLKTGRPAVSREERGGKKLVRARSGGWCELQVLGVCWGRGTDFGHRIRRSQGGLWVADGGLFCCRACHMWQDSNPLLSKDFGWELTNRQPLSTPALRRGVWVQLHPDGTYTPCAAPTSVLEDTA